MRAVADLRIIINGHQIWGVNDRLVRYRLVKKSVSHNKKSKVFLILQMDLLRFFVKTRLLQLLIERRIKTAFIIMYKSLKETIKTTLTYYMY